MTTISHPGFRTRDASLETYAPSAATLAFASLANRIAWIEGEAAFIKNGYWYDRLPAAGGAARYPITGSLVGSGDTVGSRGGPVFNGSQTVDFGNVFPVSAAYNLYVVYKQTGTGAGGGSGIVASADASYRSLHLGTTGRLFVAHNGSTVYGGAVDHALNAVHRVGVNWLESPAKSKAVTIDGAAENSSAATVSNTDAAMVVGDIPGLAGDFGFRGSLFHLSLFGAQSGPEIAATEAYLAEQYG